MNIKEMGLPEGHPEKNGVMVDTKDLVKEVREKLRRKAEGDGLVDGMNELDPNAGMENEG